MPGTNNVKHCKCGRFAGFNGELKDMNIVIKTWSCRRCGLYLYVVVSDADYSVTMVDGTPVIMQYCRQALAREWSDNPEGR